MHCAFVALSPLLEGTVGFAAKGPIRERAGASRKCVQWLARLCGGPLAVLPHTIKAADASIKVRPCVSGTRWSGIR